MDGDTRACCANSSVSPYDPRMLDFAETARSRTIDHAQRRADRARSQPDGEGQWRSYARSDAKRAAGAAPWIARFGYAESRAHDAPPHRSRARPARRTGRNDGPGGLASASLRVGEMLRHALAEILTRNEIRDADLAGVSVTVTQVKPSPDMRYATVYCEPLGGENAKDDHGGAEPPQGLSARRDGPHDRP